MERVTGWSVRTSAIDVLRGGKAFVSRRAEPIPARKRAVFAVALAGRMVARYWAAIQNDQPTAWPLSPMFATPDGRLELGQDLDWLAARIGRAAADVDPVTAGYFIGTTYAAALPSEVRARFGVYYTPPALATRLLDQATAAGLDWSCCSVLDPACGGGAFLAPVAQRIIKDLSHLEPKTLLHTLGDRLRGFEIDPVAAWMAQVFLEAAVLSTCRAANQRLPRVVELRDSLTSVPTEGRYDLVIGNPPYGRLTLPPALRAQYSASLYGHANLYGVFTDLALRWARPGGLIAYVTPTSFLGGEYFKNLRRLLSTEATPLAFDLIAHRKGVFDDVLQEALLATYVRGAQRRFAPVHVLTPIDEGTVHVEAVGTFALPAEPEQPWLVPRSPTQAGLIARMRRMPHRLRDWGYSVSTGPLVWNRHKDQLRRQAVGNSLPLIWAEAVTSDGDFILRATKVNHQPFFKPRPGDAWLITTQSCVLLQRTTAKEQARRLIAAVLPPAILRQHGGAVVENHLNMVRPLVASPPVEPGVLAAFLNSHAADQTFRCSSGSVAVSAFELESLPLPPHGALSHLRDAVKAGAGRERIDEICARLYGLARLSE